MAESGPAREVVERLLKAEAQATARLAEADARARETLERAAEEADRGRAQAAQQAAREHEDSLERARREAETASAARLEQVTRRWRTVADASGPRIDDAARRVVAWVCAESAGPDEGGG